MCESSVGNVFANLTSEHNPNSLSSSNDFSSKKRTNNNSNSISHLLLNNVHHESDGMSPAKPDPNNNSDSSDLYDDSSTINNGYSSSSANDAFEPMEDSVQMKRSNAYSRRVITQQSLNANNSAIRPIFPASNNQLPYITQQATVSGMVFSHPLTFPNDPIASSGNSAAYFAPSLGTPGHRFLDRCLSATRNHHQCGMNPGLTFQLIQYDRHFPNTRHDKRNMSAPTNFRKIPSAYYNPAVDEHDEHERVIYDEHTYSLPLSQLPSGPIESTAAAHSSVINLSLTKGERQMRRNQSANCSVWNQGTVSKANANDYVSQSHPNTNYAGGTNFSDQTHSSPYVVPRRISSAQEQPIPPDIATNPVIEDHQPSSLLTAKKTSAADKTVDWEDLDTFLEEITNQGIDEIDNQSPNESYEQLTNDGDPNRKRSSLWTLHKDCVNMFKNSRQLVKASIRAKNSERRIMGSLRRAADNTISCFQSPISNPEDHQKDKDSGLSSKGDQIATNLTCDRRNEHTVRICLPSQETVDDSKTEDSNPKPPAIDIKKIPPVLDDCNNNDQDKTLTTDPSPKTTMMTMKPRFSISYGNEKMNEIDDSHETVGSSSSKQRLSLSSSSSSSAISNSLSMEITTRNQSRLLSNVSKRTSAFGGNAAPTNSMNMNQTISAAYPLIFHRRRHQQHESVSVGTKPNDIKHCSFFENENKNCDADNDEKMIKINARLMIPRGLLDEEAEGMPIKDDEAKKNGRFQSSLAKDVNLRATNMKGDCHANRRRWQMCYGEKSSSRKPSWAGCTPAAPNAYECNKNIFKGEIPESPLKRKCALNSSPISPSVLKRAHPAIQYHQADHPVSYPSKLVVVNENRPVVSSSSSCLPTSTACTWPTSYSDRKSVSENQYRLSQRNSDLESLRDRARRMGEKAVSKKKKSSVEDESKNAVEALMEVLKVC